MRDLVITQNCTIDGVLTGDWMTVGGAPELTDVNAALREQSAAADAVLFGRKTFEEMRGFWPHQENDTSGVTDYLNRVHKYVVSTTLDDPKWDNSTIVRGEPANEIRALKDRPGKDIVATGSITLCGALIAAELVDEFRFFVYPVAAGTGRRLFGHTMPRMRLVESRPFSAGIVLLRYRTK